MNGPQFMIDRRPFPSAPAECSTVRKRANGAWEELSEDDGEKRVKWRGNIGKVKRSKERDRKLASKRGKGTDFVVIMYTVYLP